MSSKEKLIRAGILVSATVSLGSCSPLAEKVTDPLCGLVVPIAAIVLIQICRGLVEAKIHQIENQRKD